MRLALKLTAWVTAWCAIVVLAYGEHRVAEDRSLFERDLVRAEILVGHLVEPAIAHANSTGGIMAVRRVIEELNHAERSVEVSLLDWRSAHQRVEPGEASQSVKRAGRLQTIIPLKQPTAQAAAIQLSIALDFEEQVVRETRSDLYLVLAGLFVVSSCGGLLLGWLVIGRNVESLMQLARDVASGKEPRRAKIRGRDELALLGSELNRMADQLVGARNEAAEQAEARTGAENALRHADRLATIGTLTAKLAHDLGAPLQVIQTRARRVAQDPQLDEVARKNGAIMGSEAERISSSIRAVLDFSRRSHDQLRSVALGAAIERVQLLVAGRAEARQVELKLPHEGTEVALLASENAVEQVLTNLISNAIDASPAGGEVVVRVGEGGLHRGAACVLFTVQDRGPGMSAELKAHAKEPFFTTKMDGEGTGLGLSIVTGVLQANGGALEVEDRRGGGACMKVYWPRFVSS